MQFRRSGQRDERRRRVLIEEHAAASADTAPQASVARAGGEANRTPAQGYSAAARPERHPRISDLVPTRRWTLTVLVLSLLAIPVALFALDGHAPAWSQQVGRENLAALDLSARGSLADWFSSVILGLAAAASAFIYLLRRHKIDDYRGRYRFWLWSAAVLLIGSIDAATGVHRIACGLLVHASGWPEDAGGAWWTVILAGSLFGSLALRGAFEIRHSRGAAASLLVAGAFYFLAGAVSTGMVPLYGRLDVVVSQSALMLAHLTTLYCVLLFARYVLLDAQGKLPARPDRAKKPRRRRAGRAGEEASSGGAPATAAAPGNRKKGRKLRADAAHNTDDGPVEPAEKSNESPSRPLSRQAPGREAEDAAGKNSLSPSPRVSVDLDDEIADEPRNRKLSKAERRRLRKEQRRAAR